MAQSVKQLLPAHADGVHLCLEELLPYKQHTVKWLPPAKSLWSQLLGQHQSKQLGRGMDFAEVRQYQPGDDIRAIDWRVTARTGKPHTKLFSEEREKPVILYVDLSSTMQFGSSLLLKSVQAAHIASLISWLSVAEKDRIGAVIDTGSSLVEIKPTSRNKGPLQIIAQLVECQQQALSGASAPSSMQTVLMTLNRLCPKGSEVIMISDFVNYEDSFRPLFNQLRKHNRVKLVHIFDPLEQGETQFRGIERVSDGKNARWLNFSSKSDRLSIKNAFDSRKLELESLSQSMEMDYRSLSSDISLLQQLSG
ncbi:MULTISPECIES: DUF58 domain-containing protein [Vibrio]|jgi:uncharacterized protein (DUF58 family)|uniref:Uncharacterized protein DUF58 n=2 Tax=Vibrio TaxID=662 RepID=A0A2J8HC71_VIBDI|nr:MULTISPECIES: DUF58 domain-containing protein [Vibrio]MDW6019857.1 DUF58 domain-containing protein [Vibrio plantisponsor]NNM38814.1 DUF58 domain-containing protein [Vibrio plantisponsor]PNH81365.1 DUF58 domain-containing protein [Vibrio diazotrophicus]PNH87541.1 DUF58 domain-containing protein [Vibrio diazotrophicus]PNH93499.1 DUF58 domain-containing protein [Vibrio diazotrophicus]